MTVRLLPYINFPGNGAEVLTHYHEILGGTLDIQRYGDTPGDFPFSPPPDALAHGRLVTDTFAIAGGDDLGEPNGRTLGSDTHSFLLESDDVDEATRLIGRFLDAGATEAMAFERAPWGDHYGQVTDRYGVLWAFVVPGTD